MWFAKEKPAAAPGRGPGDPTPPAPFIVGCGRSGTTLLRLMLDSHRDLAIPPETHFIPELTVACAGAQDPREAFLGKITGHLRWPDFGIDAESFRRHLRAADRFDVAEGLRAFYRLYAGRFGKSRWGDKTPLYQLSMELLQGVLPEARFIHMIRDGRDVALSLRSVWFGPKTAEEAARYWAGRILEARRQSKGLRSYLEVRFEDLVQAPENTLRKVCRFIDLPWEPAMLGYHERAGERLREIERDIATPDGSRTITAGERLAMFELVRNPPRPDRTGRWKKEMGREDQAAFRKIAGDLLRELGYE